MEEINENDGLGTDEERKDDIFDPSMTGAAVDAVLEIMAESQIQVEREELIKAAEEILEENTSPLLISTAAGASGSVSITMSPGGGVESAHTVKPRNFLVNLKDAAFRLPANLVSIYDQLQKTGQSTEHMAVVAVVSLFALLSTVSTLLKVPLTKRTAAVLHTMWNLRGGGDTVPQQGLLEHVNLRFSLYHWQALDAEELITQLETLEKLNCIERINNSIQLENIRWRLKEAVNISV